MNKETLQRLRKAKSYEMMAIKALFPEQAAGHLDVIEKEIKSMLMEYMVDILKSEKSETAEQANERKSKENKSVKKVKIG